MKLLPNSKVFFDKNNGVFTSAETGPTIRLFLDRPNTGLVAVGDVNGLKDNLLVWAGGAPIDRGDPAERDFFD